MTLNWRYIYPFSTAGAYFIRRRTFEEEHCGWVMNYLHLWVRSYFFVKSGHSFFRWYALERRLKQTSQDSSFQSWLFLLLIFLGVVGILWIGMAVIFFLYSRSCDKQFLFSQGEKSVTIRFFSRTIASFDGYRGDSFFLERDWFDFFGWRFIRWDCFRTSLSWF